jgi:hypothetical protein
VDVFNFIVQNSNANDKPFAKRLDLEEFGFLSKK